MGGKILLAVDDEPANLELIQMALEESGLQVHLVTARDGLEAVARARQLRPSLVLMDLKMPLLDGWEAVRRLKSDPDTAQIPVVACTAQAMAGDRERALAAGCDDYLAKPYEIQTLLTLLKRRLA